MAVTTFNVDEKMVKVLEDLRIHYHASSRAEVLRKAVALLKIASESEAEGGSIIVRKDDVDQKIVIQ